MISAPDLIGDISLILQIIIVFLLILGVPLVKGELKNTKNFLRHGYLTAFALGLHTVLVVVIMIFLALDGFADLPTLPVLNIVLMVTHIILGFAALVLGFVVVGVWLTKPLKNLACYKVRKIMLPLIIIWAASLVIGAIIHLGELF